MTPRTGFDASARLRLDVARTTADDGNEHFVEAILKDAADGGLELELWDEDGNAIASLFFGHRMLDEFLRKRARAAA